MQPHSNGLKVLLMACAALSGLTQRAPAQVDIPITHFIFIIQENHSFDNYFGTFPHANGIPANTALPSYPGGPAVEKPFLSDNVTPPDLSHAWVSATLDYDNGAMDGFLWGEWPLASKYYGKAIPMPTPNPAEVTIVQRTQPHASVEHLQELPSGEVRSPHGFADDEDADAPDVEELNDKALEAEPKPSGTPDPTQRPQWVINTLSYYDDTVIPNYWLYAKKFTLCDEFFSALRGPSMPNHLYAVAAQSGGLVYNLPKDREAIYSFPSIVELLGGGNVTWTYYVDGNPQAETLWNPLPGFENYAGSHAVLRHLAKTSQFFKDIKGGSLPEVCWLIPDQTESEHPPKNIQTGMWYVTNLVNAVMQSSYWDSCAIIIFWDDYGGFYDHVPPSQIDQYGYGFRVPALVLSPYAQSGVVVHTKYDLTSPLSLLEQKFKLAALTNRDGLSNSMLDCFNFSQTPLPPVVIPTPTP